MARSSRHKSSRRDYSDSERERDTRRSVKESGSGELKKDVGSGSKKLGSASSSSRRREEDRVSLKEKEVVVDKGRKGDRVSIDGDRDRKGFGDNEPNRLDILQSPEADDQAGKRIKKKRDVYDNADKHLDDGFENNDRRLSYRETRQKDERHKDEKYKEKYREDVGRGFRHGDDRQRDENTNTGADHTSRRYDDKFARDDYEPLEVRQRDRGRGRDREYALEQDHHRDIDFYHDRERDRVRDRSRSRDYDRNHDKDHDYDWEWEPDQDKGRENDRKADRNRDADRDQDGSYMDDKSTRYKDKRGKKRSPDDRADFDDSATVRSRYTDREKKLMKSSRVEPDAERGRSQLRQALIETTMTGNRRRNSPNSDEHSRHLTSEDLRYRDSGLEHRQKSRDTSSQYGASERGSRYRSMEKLVKMDDGRLGELSNERSTLKTSSMGLVEQSPSATAERRYMNRTGARHSLDVEETGRRGGAFDGRNYSANDDRFSRDLVPEKPLVDESSQADLAFYGRASQGHPSINAQPSVFRAGADSPRVSLDEDSRVNNSARYRRSSDPNVGRGPGNAWRGVPNWPSPAPNGFLPFPHGPPHGGFQTMIPQFPTPPMFGVRPSVDVGHSGFPYHLSDVERFPAHMRPLGWQNMMDGSGPPHLHGWEGNNGMFRDEAHMYGGPEWEQNRQPVNGQGWESGSDVWKGQTDETNKELPSKYQKDVTTMGPQGDSPLGQASQKSEHELSQDGVQVKTVGSRSSASPVKEASDLCPQGSDGKESHLSKPSRLSDAGHYSRVYLSKLDISKELADPELYSKCIDLVYMERSTTCYKEPDEMVDNNVILVGEKTYSCLTSSSHKITMKETVFQRALDLYKNSVESRGVLSEKLQALDIFSDSRKDTLTERVAGHELEKVEASVSYEEDIPGPHGPISANVVISDGTLQNIEQSTQGLEISAATEESQPNAEGGKVDEQSTDFIMLTQDGEDTEGVCETKTNTSACDAKEKHDAGETMSALSYSDGSPKAIESLIPESNESKSSEACEAMMPESNESESVILHRIHHSPESTH